MTNYTDKTKDDGIIVLGTTQTQFFLEDNSAIGVYHKATVPAVTEKPNIVFRGQGIHRTFGTLDCYVKILTPADGTTVSFSAGQM